MNPALDPVQLGQTIGAAAVVAVTCVAAIRRGLARWKHGQADEASRDRRKLRSTVGRMLAKHLDPVTSRLEALERGLEVLQRHARPVEAKPLPPRLAAARSSKRRRR